MSRFYDRYFEGYEEHTVMKDNSGKLRKEYTYAGIFYRHAMPRKQWIEVKILYVLLTVCSLMLYLHASTGQIICNHEFYVTFFQALSLLANIWYLWVLVSYAAAPRAMKIYNFKSTSRQLKRCAPVLGGVYALTALGILVSLIRNAQERGRQAVCLLEVLLAAGMIFLVFFLEYHMRYETVPNAGGEPADDDR